MSENKLPFHTPEDRVRDFVLSSEPPAVTWSGRGRLERAFAECEAESRADERRRIAAWLERYRTERADWRAADALASVIARIEAGGFNGRG